MVPRMRDAAALPYCGATPSVCRRLADRYRHLTFLRGPAVLTLFVESRISREPTSPESGRHAVATVPVDQWRTKTLRDAETRPRRITYRKITR